MLRKIKIEHEIVQQLRELQFRERPDCHAAFTTPCIGTIWPFANFGNTIPEVRAINLYGFSPQFDEVASLVVEKYPEGARFFISKSRNRVFTKKNERAEEEDLALLDY